ncbi:hypothetical protein CEXT_110991 [Caerostris extrusa]|uniref:Uncharacterized protein n=1 Tax=Caerostris extrusa TaxID=172846 RepID=A0AAV4X738_CAEEX|nr:hypothetical protein CEXT_110991 [Caerostris extrusa]
MGIINTARSPPALPCALPPTPALAIHHMRGISNVIWDSFLKHFKHLWRDSSLAWWSVKLISLSSICLGRISQWWQIHSSSRPTNASAGKRGDEVIYSGELQRKPRPDSTSVTADSRAQIECDLFGCSMEAWNSNSFLLSTDNENFWCAGKYKIVSGQLSIALVGRSESIHHRDSAGKHEDEVIYSAELQRKPRPDSRSVTAGSRIQCDLFGCFMEA